MNDPKSALRVLLRAEYAALDDGYKNAADAEIIARVKGFSLFENSDRMFLYASTAAEINTHNLINDAFSAGKSIFLPICQAKGIMEFYEYKDKLNVGRYGIMEPTGTRCAVPTPNDLMIVPGLAFTAEGLRIGQGGGYYDRYLEKHPCITVGLCREKHLKKELPTSWNDLPVDYVITETAVYKCKNGASEEAPL